MSPLSSIVVGVDGGACGWDGLCLAQRLARLGDAELTVVCAYPALRFEHARLIWGAIALESDAQHVLETARARLDEPDDANYVAIAGATPGCCLRDVAAAHEADLLVVGGSHRGVAGRVLGGSVLMAALVEPCCPVGVSPHGHADASHELACVGVAVDGSPEAHTAISWARELACEHEQIRELRLLATGADDPPVGEPAELLAVDGERGGGTRTAFEVRWAQLSAPVARELADATAQLDLLVLGTQGRGRLARLLHGGVSGDAARSARCPLVAVPA